MGEVYKRWNADPAVRLFLEGYGLADAFELGDALEIIADPTRNMIKKYGMFRKDAKGIIFEHTGLIGEPYRIFVEDLRMKTTNRNAKY